MSSFVFYLFLSFHSADLRSFCFGLAADGCVNSEGFAGLKMEGLPVELGFVGI